MRSNNNRTYYQYAIAAVSLLLMPAVVSPALGRTSILGWHQPIGQGAKTQNPISNPSPFALSPKGDLMAYSIDENMIEVRGRASNKPMKAAAKALSLAFNSNSNRLVAGTVDRHVILWNLESGKLEKIKDFSTEKGAGDVKPMEGGKPSASEKTGIVAIAVDEGGNEIAFSDSKGTIERWRQGPEKSGQTVSWKNPALVAKNPGNEPLTCLVYGKDNALMGLRRNGALLLFKNGNPQEIIGSQTDKLSCMAFSADKQHLAIGNSTGTVHLWQIAGEKTVRMHDLKTAFSDELVGLAFVENENVLAYNVTRQEDRVPIAVAVNPMPPSGEKPKKPDVVEPKKPAEPSISPEALIIIQDLGKLENKVESPDTEVTALEMAANEAEKDAKATRDEAKADRDRIKAEFSMAILSLQIGEQALTEITNALPDIEKLVGEIRTDAKAVHDSAGQVRRISKEATQNAKDLEVLKRKFQDAKKGSDEAERAFKEARRKSDDLKQKADQAKEAKKKAEKALQDAASEHKKATASHVEQPKKPAGPFGKLSPGENLRPGDECPPIMKLGAHGSVIYSVAHSHRKTWLVSGGGDKFIQVWSLSKKKYLNSNRCEDVVQTVAFNQDGSLMASGKRDNKIKIYDANNETGPIDRNDISDAHPQPKKSSEPALVTSLAFDPQNNYILWSGGSDGTIARWNVDDQANKEEWRSNRCPKGLYSIAINADCTNVAGACLDGNLYVWNINSQDPKDKQFQAKGWMGGLVRGVVFLTDDILAAGNSLNQVMLWRVSGNKLEPLGKLDGHTAAIRCLAYDPDRELLASSGEDKTIRLWNLRGWDHKTPLTAESIKGRKTVLTGHMGIVRSLAFSKYGERDILISGCADQYIRIWNVDQFFGPPAKH